VDEAIVGRLQVLGFSLYEARVYVALLRHGPQNGNEVAKSASLPSSKVYSTLERLVSKGIVHTVRSGGSTQYVCVLPEELLPRLRQDFVEPLEFLERTLPSLGSFEPAAEVLTVAGLDAILESSRSILRNAREELYLSVWTDDIAFLADDLVNAHDRNVRIYGMFYGDDPPPEGTGSWLMHAYRQIVSDRIGGRMLTLVADGEEALMAHIPSSSGASGVRTRNPVLALIAREYLHHDLVLQRAQIAIGFGEWDRWWQADPELRAIIISGGESAGASRTKKPARGRRGASASSAAGSEKR
jgi:HTH-type transcriptional regulator, sugar sensing transcriptional regulator